MDRAWPGVPAMPAGSRVIRFEGRDGEGRLRAGRLVGSGRGATSTATTVTPHGTDRRLPGLAKAVEDGELVVHRLGRRAVVRQGDRYVKVLRPGSSARTVATRAQMGAEIVAAAGFATPSVLAAPDGRLDLSILVGVALHEAGQTMELTEWRLAWDAWASAWTGLTTDSPRTAGETLPAHTAADELAGLRSWLGQVRTFTALPRLEHELTRRCAALAGELAATRAEPLVVSHRDLHDKQLLWDGTTIGVLDLDTLARAEAACDLANLAVHAELRALQGLWSVAHRDIVLDRVEQVARALGLAPPRVAAYAEATRLRLTMLYAFRPRWAPLMADWLHERSLIAVSST